jgi:hypothetical protein
MESPPPPPPEKIKTYFLGAYKNPLSYYTI